MKRTENFAQHNYSFVWMLSITIILLLAYSLRLHGINERSLWFDEAIEYWMAVVPLTEIHQAVAEATHDPPLYSYFLHLWMSIGFEEFWLRMPSLYFSMLGLSGLIWLAKREFDPITALAAASIMSVNTADIRYAQETGQYSLMVFLLTFNLLFLYRTTKDESWRYWILWGITSLLSIYSHYGTTIVILTTVSTFLLYNFWRRQWTAVKKQIVVGIITVSLTLPLIFIIIPQQLNRLGAAQLSVNGSQFLSTSSQIVTFQWLGNYQLLFGWPWPQIPSWIGWLPVVIAVSVALIKSPSIQAPPILLIVTWLGYYLISRTGAYFFSGTRHSLLITPLLILSVASGITILGRKNKFAALFILCPIILISLFVPREPQEDLRSVTQYLLSHRQVEDSTFIFYGAVPGFQYQLDLVNGHISNLPRNWYGACWGGNPDLYYCGSNNIYFGLWTRTKTPDERNALLLDKIGYYPNRLWLVFSHVQPDEERTLVDVLQSQYQISSKQSFEGASLILLERQ